MVISFSDDNPSTCLRAAFSDDDIGFHHRFKAPIDSAYRNACYGRHLSNSHRIILHDTVDEGLVLSIERIQFLRNIGNIFRGIDPELYRKPSASFREDRIGIPIGTTLIDDLFGEGPTSPYSNTPYSVWNTPGTK